MQSIDILTGKAENSSVPQLQSHRFYHHTRQKTPLKIYNSNLNQFEYEAIAKQKRNQLEEFNAINTPSNISLQSFVINNDSTYSLYLNNIQQFISLFRNSMRARVAFPS